MIVGLGIRSSHSSSNSPANGAGSPGRPTASASIATRPWAGGAAGSTGRPSQRSSPVTGKLGRASARGSDRAEQLGWRQREVEALASRPHMAELEQPPVERLRVGRPHGRRLGEPRLQRRRRPAA